MARPTDLRPAAPPCQQLLNDPPSVNDAPEQTTVFTVRLSGMVAVPTATT
jgi:hypothetical protein